MVTALERSFGFELELATGGHEVARALNAAHLAHGTHQHYYHCTCAECTDYFGRQGNWLKVQNDSSCGGEVISSPLRFDWADNPDAGGGEISPHYLMRELTEVLSSNDVTIDNNCGIHVHVGARDLSDRQLGRLYELVHHYEAVLYRLACGRSERHRGYDNSFTYCRPLSAFDNPLEAKYLATLKSAMAKESLISKSKYVVANLVPIDSLGTVEFRLWESTRRPLRLNLYTRLSVALVQRAKARHAPRGRPIHLGYQGNDGDLLDMLADLQEHVPELVNDEMMDEALWQWSCLPDWQLPPRLQPLTYFDRRGVQLTTDSEEIVEAHGGPSYFVDSHGVDHPIEQTEEQRASLCDRPECRHCVRERASRERWDSIPEQPMTTPAPVWTVSVPRMEQLRQEMEASHLRPGEERLGREALPEVIDREDDPLANRSSRPYGYYSDEGTF